MERIGLKTRVALTVSLLFVLFATIISLYVVYSGERDYRSSLATHQYSLVSSVAEAIDDKLVITQRALIAEGGAIPLRAMVDADAAQSYLDNRKALLSIFDNGLFLLSSNGRLIAESPYLPGRRNRDISFRDFFKKTVATGRPVISAPYVSTHTPGHPAIMLTVPLYTPDRKLAAILAGSFDLLGENFLEELTKARINSNGYLYLLNNDRTMIVHPDRNRIMKPYEVKDNALLDRVMQGFEGSGELVNPLHEKVFASFKHLEQTPWVVAAEYPLAKALQPLERAKRTLGLVTLGCTALILGGVWLLMYRLLSPLTAFTRHVETLPEKSGEEKLVRIEGPKEIGTLAQAFNTMVVALDKEHEALSESEYNFKALAENANEGMLIVAGMGVILYANRQATVITGYGIEELRTVSFEELVHRDCRKDIVNSFRRVIAGEQVEPIYECFFVRRNGDVISTEVAGARTLWHGEPAELLMIRDVSHRKQTEQILKDNEERLKFLAHHDSLTELPNRLLCYDRLRQAMARTRRSGQLVAVLFIDLDRFKNVNDSLGHEVGDLLLREVSQRLSYWVRESDTVARLGGDEFVIILEQIDDARYAAVVAQKLIGVLSQPIMAGGHELYITISIGITLFPTDGTDVDGLMKCADVAMYSAKEDGRNNYKFYTPDMNSRTREILQMEGELRRALEHEQFMLYYQPQFDLASGDLVGMEALLRWQHPIKGVVPPDQFISLAEDNGLIVPLGEWVIYAACRQNKAWQDRGVTPFRVAVNISPRQFRFSNLASVVGQALEHSGLEPRWLELEITESMIIGNVDSAIRTMEELNAMGVRLAIDDFGTGYSSLGHLKHFPITRLKIDKSFIKGITENPNDEAIATAIIALGHSMSLEVIAEGVETDGHLRLLRELGCEQGQGYLFSRPQPAHLLQSFLTMR